MKYASGLACGTAFIAVLTFFAPAANAFTGSTYYLLQTLTDSGPYNHSVGASVAASGGTVIIGDPDAYVNAGVNVYVRSDGVWALQQRLTEQSFNGCSTFRNVWCFGYSVGIDGETVVVGNPAEGRAWPFVREGQSWSSQGLFDGTNFPVESFGESVAVSGDHAAVTGYIDGELVWVPELGQYLNYSRRAVFMFARSNGIWTFEQALTAGGLGLYVEDPIALVGDSLIVYRGSAYPFAFSQGAWVSQQRIDPEYSDTAYVYPSVGFDGEHLVIGGYDSIVRIFAHSAEGWTLKKTLSSNEGAYFGRAVSVKDDVLAIGAEGRVYLYRSSGDDWVQEQQFSRPEGFNPDFGSAVAIGDGFLVVGACDRFSYECNSDRAYIFGEDSVAPSISEPIVYGPILWPPDHQLKDFTVSYTTSDCCGPVAESLSVASNEPANGIGDGDTAPDWEVIDAHNIRLRAERSATGTGRIYTVTVTAVDASGNTSHRSVTVSVPIH